MQHNALNDSALGPYKVNSLRIDPLANPMSGIVTWDPWRSLWNGSMLICRRHRDDLALFDGLTRQVL